MTQAGTAVHGEFSEFYAVNFPRIAAQLYAYLGDHAEAQDVTQEAFVRALDRWAKVSTYAHAQVWVRQVAWNLATSRLRHLQVARRYLARQRAEHVDGPSPDRVALVDALAELPPKHRLAVVLHHVGQLSTAEIAEQEGVAEGTVRSWLSRGRARLAEHFEESLAAPGIPAPGVAAAATSVRRRRTARRATLAAVLALVIAIPVAILLRDRGGDPPIIVPPSPSIEPTPGPTVRKISVPGMTLGPLPDISFVDGRHAPARTAWRTAPTAPRASGGNWSKWAPVPYRRSRRGETCRLSPERTAGCGSTTTRCWPSAPTGPRRGAGCPCRPAEA